MNPEASASLSQFSQFQLIGGIKRDPADTFLLIEPGGTAQQRKGALYLAAEASDPALGGEATQLVLGTVAREYYEDHHPTVTSSLNEALNRANQALIHYNRQSLNADVPAGLPRKMRVGLTAAVAKNGQLYICQLKPSFAIFVHEADLTTFPRPRHWPDVAPRLSADGVLMPNLYQAAPLGSGPVVELDYTFRRFDAASMLVLCSSNIAPLLDPLESREWLTGRPASAIVEYLLSLAKSHSLAESHAVAIDAIGSDGKRSTGLVYMNTPVPRIRTDKLNASEVTAAPADAPAPPAARQRPPTNWGETDFNAPRQSAPADPAPTLPRQDEDRHDRLSRPVAIPADSEDHLPAYLRGRPIPPPPASDLPPLDFAPTNAEPAPAPSGGETFSRMREGMGRAGKAAAPVLGRAGRFAGKAGRRTLGGVGTLLQHTLPESVRQRGADGIFNPPQSDLDAPDAQYEQDEQGGAYEQDDEPQYNNQPIAQANYDYEQAAPQREPMQRPTWLRWLVPLLIVLLLGVLLFSVQQVLSGQQTVKIDGLLAEARQYETTANASGDPATRRQNLLDAEKKIEDALVLDPQSVEAAAIAKRLQDELDLLDNVQRLTGLTLLADLSDKSATAAVAITGSAILTNSTDITATSTLSDATTTTADDSDYLSQLLVHGDDIYLLDRGSGKLFSFSLKTDRYTAILTPGQSVDQVGDASNPAKVGQLLYVTWRPVAGAAGDLAAVDADYHAYIRDPNTNGWQAFFLGGIDGYERPQDFGAYDGNLYLLRGHAGQVTKWAAGAYNAPGADWISAQAANELRPRNPLAMAIDGDIEVLLGNGQVTTLAGGEIKKTTVLSVWPPIVNPLALFSAEGTSSFYVVEGSDKRIIRVDKASGTLQGQLKVPADSNAFDGLRNVYVDEQQNKLYILSGKRLYSADLPTAAVIAPTPGPTAAATPAETPAAPTPTLKPVQLNP